MWRPVFVLWFSVGCTPPPTRPLPEPTSGPATSAASADIAVPSDIARWSREEMIARGAELTPELVVALVEDERTNAVALEALAFMPGSEDALGLLARRALARRSSAQLAAMERILSTSRTLQVPEDVEAARAMSRALEEISREPGDLGLLASNVLARLRARGLVGGE